MELLVIVDHNATVKLNLKDVLIARQEPEVSDVRSYPKRVVPGLLLRPSDPPFVGNDDSFITGFKS